MTRFFAKAPTGWNDMATAPKSGPVILLTFAGFVVKAQWETGFTDVDLNACGGWTAFEEEQHPPCWTDGACWSSNANEIESDQPVAWLPFPTPELAA